MRKTTLLLFLLFSIICLSACARRGSIADSGRDDIYNMVGNGVPYAGYGDYKLDYVWHKETDAYGRELFLYQSELYAIDGRQDIWVISQKTEGDYVYYYEDFFYITCPNSGEISQADLSILKEKNDWNKPLEQAKMVGLRYKNKEYQRLDYYFQLEEGDKIKD